MGASWGPPGGSPGAFLAASLLLGLSWGSPVHPFGAPVERPSGPQEVPFWRLQKATRKLVFTRVLAVLGPGRAPLGGLLGLSLEAPWGAPGGSPGAFLGALVELSWGSPGVLLAASQTAPKTLYILAVSWFWGLARPLLRASGGSGRLSWGPAGVPPGAPLGGPPGALWPLLGALLGQASGGGKNSKNPCTFKLF